jgi:ornithine carbamoyltransferase
MKLQGRDFLTVLDYSTEELEYLLKLSTALKIKKQNNQPHNYLSGKNVVLLFEKDSTRTRCAFQSGAQDLGMNVTYLGPNGSHMGKKETIADTARVLCRMYDGIEFRGYDHATVEGLAKYSDVPVWNGLTDKFHPTQVLADFLTVQENFGKLKGLKFVYMGDAHNNTANSLMLMSAKLGVNFVACAPEKLFPDAELVAKAEVIAKKNGSTITLTADVVEGTKNADVLYTDVWVSMGEPDEVWAERITLLTPYRVDKKAMNNANEKAIFLHCLPAFHNTNTKVGKEMLEKFGIEEMEVSDEVFESKQSKVFDQAENRLHTIKAVMYATLK